MSSSRSAAGNPTAPGSSPWGFHERHRGRSRFRGLFHRRLALPVQVPASQLPLVVQVWRTAEPQHIARELVEALLLAVRAGCRRALLAVVDERRILVLVGHEPSEVAAV